MHTSFTERFLVRNTRRVTLALMPLAASTALLLQGCTPQELAGYLPGFNGDTTPVTNHTERIAGLWVTSWIVLLVVGVLTWGLMIWAAVAYRRRKNDTGLPQQLRYNMPIEVFYTIVPLILIVGFFAFTARDQAAIEARIENPDVKIEAFGKQWSWDFNYIDEDVHSIGIQAQEDPNGEPGAMQMDKLPTLYLPVGKTVEIELEARDVIHSFWVPEFLYKKDMIPGKTNWMTFTPMREGTYAGKCAELCGEYHSIMLFNVKVVSQAEYDEYIESLRAAGNTGLVSNEYDRNQNLPGTDAPAEEESE